MDTERLNCIRQNYNRVKANARRTQANAVASEKVLATSSIEEEGASFINELITEVQYWRKRHAIWLSRCKYWKRALRKEVEYIRQELEARK